MGGRVKKCLRKLSMSIYSYNRSALVDEYVGYIIETMNALHIDLYVLDGSIDMAVLNMLWKSIWRHTVISDVSNTMIQTIILKGFDIVGICQIRHISGCQEIIITRQQKHWKN